MPYTIQYEGDATVALDAVFDKLDATYSYWFVEVTTHDGEHFEGWLTSWNDDTGKAEIAVFESEGALDRSEPLDSDPRRTIASIDVAELVVP